MSPKLDFLFPKSYKANRPKAFQWLGRVIMKIMGWRIKGEISDSYSNKKFVAIVAPHTSNWDAIVGLAAITAVDLKVYFIGKHTIFKGLLGKFIRYMGGIPVDRSKPGGLIKDLLSQIEDKKNGLIGLSPEGTRTKVEEWKTGFLRIARELNSGVVLVSLDFLKKELVFGKEFMPTGDDKKDIMTIREYYSSFTPRHPRNF